MSGAPEEALHPFPGPAPVKPGEGQVLIFQGQISLTWQNEALSIKRVWFNSSSP
jgi:hypothetical protein